MVALGRSSQVHYFSEGNNNQPDHSEPYHGRIFRSNLPELVAAFPPWSIENTFLASPVPTCILTPQGAVIGLNTHLVEALGYDRGLPAPDTFDIQQLLVPTQDNFDAWTRLLNSAGEMGEEIILFQHPNPQYRHKYAVNCMVKPYTSYGTTSLLEQSGSKVRLLLQLEVSQDIKLAETIRNIPHPMMLIDSRNRVISNTKLVNDFGWGEDPRKGIVTASTEIHEVRTRLETTRETIQSIPLHLNHADGRIIEVEAHIQPHFFNGVMAMVFSILDINNSAQSEIQPEQKPEEPKTPEQAMILDAMRDMNYAYALTELDTGEFVTVDGKFLEILGLNENIVGENTLDLNVWHDPASRVAYVERLIRDEVVHEFSTRFCRQDGEVVHVMLSGKLVQLGDRKLIFTLVRDNGELAEATRRIAALEKSQLSRQLLDAMREELLSDARHDMATPINSLQVRAYLLQKTPEKLEEHLQIIAGALSDLETQRQQLTLETLDELAENRRNHQDSFNIHTLLRSHAEVHAAAIKSTVVGDFHHETDHQVSIKLELDKDYPNPHVLGDLQSLNRILGNVISNAVKYSYSGGEVTISTQIADGIIYIQVSDQGIGISEEWVKRITENINQEENGIQFNSQVRAPNAKNIRGTGRGLVSARRRLHSIHGMMELESPGENQGTTVTIRLPIFTPES